MKRRSKLYYNREWNRKAFKLGYMHGRQERPWPSGKKAKPEKDQYYRGWNLGVRVTRHLRAYYGIDG